MHRYWVLTRFYLILSILNLVLAAPIVVQRIHDAPRAAEDLAAMKKRLVEAVLSDRSILPRLPPNDPEPEPGPASPQHSTLSDEPVVSETDLLDSGYPWSLPPSPDPDPPASLHDSSSLHRPSSGPPALWQGWETGSLLSRPHLPESWSLLSSPTASEASQGFAETSQLWQLPAPFPDWESHHPSSSAVAAWLDAFQADAFLADNIPFLHVSTLSDSGSPRASDPGPAMTQTPEWLQGLETPPSPHSPSLASSEESEMSAPEWLRKYALALERQQSPPPSAELTPPTSPHPPSSASSETSDSDLPFLEWLQEFAHAPPHRRDLEHALYKAVD